MNFIKRLMCAILGHNWRALYINPYSQHPSTWAKKCMRCDCVDVYRDHVSGIHCLECGKDIIPDDEGSLICTKCGGNNKAR